jgi:CRP-like cAMP-binding protein
MSRFNEVDARLARWLFMTHGRLQSDEFPLTQKFLSDLLGVRREGVTVAARVLQRKTLIRYIRGKLSILNCSGLKAASCKCSEIID